MAGQADGSIIIDTELDSKGFDADSRELLAAIQSLTNEVKNLGDTLKGVFAQPLSPDINTGSAEKEVDSLEAKIHELEATIETMQRETGNGNIPLQFGSGGNTQKVNELQRQIDAVNNSVNSLEPTFQKAMAGSGTAISSFETKASDLQDRIESLRQKINSFAQTKIPTEAYADISAEAEKAGQRLEKLLNKQERMEELGVKTNSAQWKALQYDLDLARQGYERLEAAKARMESAGTAYQTGVNTAEYSRMEATLSKAQARLSEMQGGLGQSSGHMRRLASYAQNVASHIKGAAKAVLGTLVRGLKSAVSHMARLAFHGQGMKGQFAGLISSAKKFTLSLLGARGVYALLRRAVSAYMAENQELANTLSACWSGIGNILGPIITRLINLVAQAVAYVTSFLRLFGIFGKGASKAISKAGGAASGAAKELKRQLAAFDELNILNDNNSDSGGGGGADAGTGSLPEVTLPDWAKNIADLLKAGDWSGAATVLAEKLNELVDSVDWAKLGQKIGYYLNGALTFLATFIKKFNWKALGSDLAVMLNNVITSVDWKNLGVLLAAKLLILLQFLTGFFEQFDGKEFGDAIYDVIIGAITACDWVGLSGELARNVSNFITSIDFGKLANAISKGSRTALQSLNAAVTNFDWEGVGKKIAEFINGIDWVGIIGDLATFVSNVLSGALELLIGFVEELDWGKLGNDLFESIKAVVQNIDWERIISLVFELLGAFLGANAALYLNLGEKFWEALKQGWEDTKEYFSKYIEEAGGNIIEGLWNGIVNALKNVGTWIITNIWDPFISGFKSAFGIHSPSTKMEEQGGFIIEGLLNGIKNAWGGITGFFSTALETVSGTISTAWNGIKSTTSTVWTAAKTGLSNTWNGIKSTASTTWDNLKTTISSGWNNAKSNTTESWNNVKATLSTSWNNIKSTASKTWDNLKSSIAKGWESIKSDTNQKWNTVKTSLSTTWNNIKSTASTTWNNMKSTASSSWNNMKSDAVNTWNGIKTTLSTTWNNIKSTASTTWSGIKSTIENQGWSGVGSNICRGIQNGIEQGWAWLKTTVGNLAKNLLTAAKNALGIKSPSRVFRDEVGLNIGYGVGEGVEDAEPSILRSVNAITESIAKEINAGDYTLSEIAPAAKINGAITDFSDRIVTEFSSMLDRMQQIADSVTFNSPVLSGSMVPYQTAAYADAGRIMDVESAITGSNDEMMDVVTQVVTNAASSIVSAIRDYSGVSGGIDRDAITDQVIEEINRRTRMFNKSPLLR